MIFDLTGRRALVAGAGEGVGAGIARLLGAQGAGVVVNDVVGGRAGAVVDEIGRTGGQAVASVFDVTDPDAVTGAVAEIGRVTGPVDILVNNAGNAGTATMALTPFRAMTDEQRRAPVAVNLFGVMHVTAAGLDGMCERQWGRIVTISSTAGVIGTAIGVAPYSAGKGGALALMRSLAMEVAADGVTVNSIAVGLQRQGDPGLDDMLGAAIPVGRPGTPDDVAAACLWLVSGEAAWVTGQTIGVNGGMATS